MKLTALAGHLLWIEAVVTLNIPITWMDPLILLASGLCNWRSQKPGLAE